MLRLRSRILSHLLSPPSASPIPFPLHRLLSAVSTNPSFAVEDYLVATCGLTRAQALKASTKLSHLKSPTNPDAVLAFLAGLGLSTADVTAVVAKDPLFLCAGVERTLTPIVAGLTAAVGLSSSEVGRLVSVAPHRFRCRTVVSNLSNLRYCLPLFGSYEKLLRVVNRNRNTSLLACSPETVLKPNVTFLQECGLDANGIASLCLSVPRLLGSKPEHVRAMAARAESIGVPRGSGMFKSALRAVGFRSKENIAVKVEYLKNTFRWSDAEVGIAVCKAPLVLTLSKDILQRKSEFLISKAGLEPAYILHRLNIFSRSLEGRLRPRYYVIKFLKVNGLLDRDRDYYQTVKLAEKAFMDKYICPHKEAAPKLAQDYAAARRGEMPTRFSLLTAKGL